MLLPRAVHPDGTVVPPGWDDDRHVELNPEDTHHRSNLTKQSGPELRSGAVIFPLPAATAVSSPGTFRALDLA